MRPEIPPASPPKRRFGQHFLKDPNTARIVAEGVTKDDVVLEVGPGRGFLTGFLAEKAKLVHAVEIDQDVLPALEAATGGKKNVRVYVADALRFDYASLRPAPNKLVANLPYNVAAPLVLRLLEEVESLKTFRFMVQLEVARRMAAKRKTKDYAGYAVLVQLLAEPKVLHRVPPTVFDPPPRVLSAVVEMSRRETNLSDEEYRGTKELILAAFSNRRKRLVNNLPKEEKAAAAEALRSLGLGEGARAEELSPEDFVALYKEVWKV